MLDLLSRMRQNAKESAKELEDSVEQFERRMEQVLQNMRGQLADLVESGQGGVAQAPLTLPAPQARMSGDQEEEAEPASAPQASSRDAYERHQQWWPADVSNRRCSTAWGDCLGFSLRR